MFPWLVRDRRASILAQPFPAAWLPHLDAIAFYPILAADEQARLRDLVKVLIAEKNWEGCRGLTITDEIKVTIAAQACLLILGMEPREHDFYIRVQSILVYPAGFRIPGGRRGTLLVEEDGIPATGMAVYRGPVLLAWDEVVDGARHLGREQNVVFHEFAHQLDMLNGAVDGTPLINDPDLSARWAEVMKTEYERLVAGITKGRRTFLDPYGAEDEGEFFAVTTEAFFTCPVEMQRHHPRLYEVLREFYRQNPALRLR
jgi:Mlc titration factor MtfA (ptsG expression regulator)